MSNPLGYSNGNGDKYSETLYEGALTRSIVNDLEEAGMEDISEFRDANVVLERQESSSLSNGEDGYVLKWESKNILMPWRGNRELSRTYSLEDLDVEKVEEVFE